MPNYDENAFIKLLDLKQIIQRSKTELQTATANAIKYISVSGNTVSFFKTADGSGIAAYTVDFPKDLFLDQTKTKLVPNFAFNATAYPGATNPSLDGKPVFVLAVKGTTNPESGTASDTVNYSFLDMTSLVDVYTIKEGVSKSILTITDNAIEVHISSAANQAITVKPDGLHVDISEKADKDVDAVEGHVAIFDGSGNPVDSGVKIATSAEVTAMLAEVWGD